MNLQRFGQNLLLGLQESSEAFQSGGLQRATVPHLILSLLIFDLARIHFLDRSLFFQLGNQQPVVHLPHFEHDVILSLIDLNLCTIDIGSGSAVGFVNFEHLRERLSQSRAAGVRSKQSLIEEQGFSGNRSRGRMIAKGSGGNLHSSKFGKVQRAGFVLDMGEIVRAGNLLFVLAVGNAQPGQTNASILLEGEIDSLGKSKVHGSRLLGSSSSQNWRQPQDADKHPQ